MSHIFISYSRKDLDFAQQIVDALAANDLDTWIDWKSIPKGEDWEKEIYRGIEEADAFLFLISPDSVASEMCNKEIAHGVKNGKRILPIVIRDADPKSIQSEISKRNWIFCRDVQDDFKKAIEEAHNTIHTDYEWLKYHTELQVKALKWDQWKDSSRLLRGKELQEAEERLAEVSSLQDPQPTELQRLYVLTGRRETERNRRQITFSLIAGLAIMTVLTIFALSLRAEAASQRQEAVSQKETAQAASTLSVANAMTAQAERIRAEEQARIARAGELAGLSLANQSLHPDLSILFAIEAIKTHESFQTEGLFLRRENLSPQLSKILYSFSSQIHDLAISQNNVLASTSCVQSFGARCVLSEISFMALPSGKDMGKISVEDNYIFDIEFSPDGKTLALSKCKVEDAVYTTCVENEVAFVDLTSLQLTSSSLVSENRITSLRYSPNGNYLAIQERGNRILLLDVKTNGPKPFSGSGTFQTFSLDSMKIILSQGEQLIIWDIDSNSDMGNLVANGLEPKQVVFSSHSMIVVLPNNTIHLLDAESQKQLGQPITISHGEIIRIIVDDESSYFTVLACLKTLDGDCELEVSYLSTQTGKQVYRSEINRIGKMNALGVSPDGNYLVSGGDDGNILVLDLWNNNFIEQELFNHSRPVTALSFSMDGRQLASGGMDGNLVLYDVLNQEIKTIPPRTENEMEWVLSIAYAPPDGNQLAFGTTLGDIVIVNSQTGEVIKRIETRQGIAIQSIAFSSDGTLLAAGGDHHKIWIWKTEDYEQIRISPLQERNWISTLEFTPDDKYLISATGDEIAYWDLDTGEVAGNRLAHHMNWIEHLDLRNDGKVFATASDDRTIIIWDAASREPVSESLLSNMYGVWTLQFSPSQNMLAYSSEDGIALLDLDTLNVIGILNANNTSADALSFSPDGKLLAAAYMRRIIIWNLEQDRWIENACQTVNRNFTQAEWGTYFPKELYHITCPQWPAGE